MGNGYVSGNKTIRGELVQKIQNMPAEELASHVQLLNLRDIPTVILTIQKLLTIADISDSLRDRLLDKADTTDEYLFIAEIFQQSLKYHNLKIKLSNEDKSFLNNLWDYDIVKQDPTNNENLVDETSTFSSSSNSEYTTGYDEIDQIIEQARNDALNTIDSDEDSAYWKRFHLPADFKPLIKSIAPILIGENTILPLDFVDMICVCNLDLETQTCGDGHIEMLVASCPKDDVSMYTNALKQIKNCTNAIIHITGDLELSLTEVEDLTHALSAYIEPDANILWGVCIDANIYDRYVIQLICYIKDSVAKDDSLSRDDINQVIDSYMDSIVVEKPKEKRKEIDIPYFLRR